MLLIDHFIVAFEFERVCQFQCQYLCRVVESQRYFQRYIIHVFCEQVLLQGQYSKQVMAVINF